METYRSLVAFLKKKYPDFRVSIRRTTLPERFDGLCAQKKDNTFSIRIDKTIPERYVIDVLLHEFAHVMAWEKDSNVHGVNWGIAYSKLYRAYLEEFRKNHVSNKN